MIVLSAKYPCSPTAVQDNSAKTILEWGYSA